MVNKHMRSRTTALTVRELQIKATTRFQFISMRMAIKEKAQEIIGIGDNVEKLDPSALLMGK